MKMPFYVEDSLGDPMTGLSAFTVYRSRNGSTPVAYTTPTIAEASSVNTPGLYHLTLDEDTTIDADHDSEEMTIFIKASGMPNVVRTVTIERNLADVVLNRDFADIDDTNARTALNALRLLRNKYTIAGTVLAVTKEDDTTPAWFSSLTTNASAQPITGSDPA
jgi:hypothetical protein